MKTQNIVTAVILSALTCNAALQIDVNSSKLIWDSTPGETYIIMQTENLRDTAFIDIGTNIATGATSEWQYIPDAEEQFFYLLIQQGDTIIGESEIVGYTRFYAFNDPAYPRTLTSAALNFIPHTNTVRAIIGDQLPQLSVLYVWDKDLSTWQTAAKTRAGWPATATLDHSDAFFISLPQTAPLTNAVTLSGRVLEEDFSKPLPAGVYFTGLGYPTETYLLDTDLAVDLPNLSAIYIWDEAIQDYESYSKGAGGLNGNPLIKPAQAFWIHSSESIIWQETVPFSR